MVSAVGLQHRHLPLIPPKAQKPEGQQQAGKSLDSVGHQAKAKVIADVDTAPNAQGKAAAMLAKMDLSAMAPRSVSHPFDGDTPAG